MKTAAIYLNEGNESQFGVPLEEQLEILTKLLRKNYHIEKFILIMKKTL